MTHMELSIINEFFLCHTINLNRRQLSLDKHEDELAFVYN